MTSELCDKRKASPLNNRGGPYHCCRWEVGGRSRSRLARELSRPLFYIGFSFGSPDSVHAGQRADGARRDEGGLRPCSRVATASTATATRACCCLQDNRRGVLNRAPFQRGQRLNSREFFDLELGVECSCCARWQQATDQPRCGTDSEGTMNRSRSSASAALP